MRDYSIMVTLIWAFTLPHSSECYTVIRLAFVNKRLPAWPVCALLNEVYCTTVPIKVGAGRIY